MAQSSPTSSQARAGVQKFQFDDFDAADSIVAFEEAAPDPTFTLEDLSLAKMAAEATGHARGVEETEAAIAAETARLLTRIMEDTTAVLIERQNQRDFIAAEAVRLSTAIARKVLPAMAETSALREIETLIARCLNERPEESRLVIRLNDAMLDPVRQKMDRLVEEAGFGAKPVLLADPMVKRAEIRIEWANGGVDWNFDLALSDMEAAARRLAARPVVKIQAEIIEESEQ